MAFANTDIVNSEDWSTDDFKTFFKDRLSMMRSKRAPYDTKWKAYENQTNAISFYDEFNHLKPNIPLEKTLIEIYAGRVDGKINFDVLPDGQTNIDELQPAKYALLFFMD